jgi:hypothetical protein
MQRMMNKRPGVVEKGLVLIHHSSMPERILHSLSVRSRDRSKRRVDSREIHPFDRTNLAAQLGRHSRNIRRIQRRHGRSTTASRLPRQCCGRGSGRGIRRWHGRTTRGSWPLQWVGRIACRGSGRAPAREGDLPWQGFTRFSYCDRRGGDSAPRVIGRWSRGRCHRGTTHGRFHRWWDTEERVEASRCWR